MKMSYDQVGKVSNCIHINNEPSSNNNNNNNMIVYEVSQWQLNSHQIQIMDTQIHLKLKHNSNG